MLRPTRVAPLNVAFLTSTRGPLRRLTLATAMIALAASAGLLAASPQSARGRVFDPRDDKPWPDFNTLAEAGRIAEALPLFATNQPLAVSLVADFGAVQRDREPESSTMYPARVVVARRDGTEASIPARIRTRGHSRLKPDLCVFAPLWIEFESNPVGTVFEGQKKLKLGTHCREDGDYPQYVIREYPVYRMFNLLTPRSFRARLADARYVDAKSGKTIAARGALFLEDDDDVARRMGGRISDSTGVSFRQIDAPTTTLMALFEYMIGNSDLSIRALHNVRLVLTPRGRFPVPYDFDFSGLVDTPYAAPHPLLQRTISSVRERVYLGPCRTPAELEELFDRFRAVRSDLLAVYDSVPTLKPKYVTDARKYLDQFFQTIDRPERVKKAFIDQCGTRPFF